MGQQRLAGRSIRFERDVYGPSDIYNAVQIPVSLGQAMRIQHVHGTVSLSVPKTGVKGSIIAILRDQEGNAIAAVKMQEFGDATATIPIDATLACDLPVTSLQLQYYVDMPGTQVVSMSLVLN
ncbi:MAG TPA: hypothetical protein VFW94_09480 [Candidatus Acidoferrales bacterium]|nr:hypothetical protein [Candidatus Acidoferrales bacterium]